MPKKAFVRVIADYSAGDLAFAEIQTALNAELYGDGEIDPTINTTPVPSFDTIGTGFVLAQLARAERQPKNILYFVNCAPRKDRGEARSNNEGEGLTFVRLQNDVPVVVVNSGYSLSFIRNSIKGGPRRPEFFHVNVERGGSQFRSRDIFPGVVARALREDWSFLGKRLSLGAIPKPPRGVTAYRDSFGNLKTTWDEDDPRVKKLKSGQPLSIKIGEKRLHGVFSSGSFNVIEGQIALSRGSSGHNRRYFEIFLRGGNAWETFDRPDSGTKVEFEAVSH